ncbi:MAG: hypothetical protein EOO38_16670 [Cytophagaceae bacterium]|nr:MAG: hypothetical protein EOO38_16670 [Cytophagaceae bacterium]
MDDLPQGSTEERIVNCTMPGWVANAVEDLAAAERVAAERIMIDAVIDHLQRQAFRFIPPEAPTSTSRNAIIRLVNYVVCEAAKSESGVVRLVVVGERFSIQLRKNRSWQRIESIPVGENRSRQQIEAFPAPVLQYVARRLSIMAFGMAVPLRSKRKIWFYEITHGLSFRTGEIGQFSVDLGGDIYDVVFDDRMPKEILLLVEKV